MSLHNRIKSVRKDHKISQKELGQMIGKSMRAIQKYENGEIQPSLEVLKKIADVLNVPFSALSSEYEVIEINKDSVCSDNKSLTMKTERFKYNQKYGEKLVMPYTVENYKLDTGRYFIDSFINFIKVDSKALDIVISELDLQQLENTKKHIEDLLEAYKLIENK